MTLFIKKYQKPNIETPIEPVAHQVRDALSQGTTLFSTIDLKYATSELLLHPDTARHGHFNIISGKKTGTYRFKSGI